MLRPPRAAAARARFRGSRRGSCLLSALLVLAWPASGSPSEENAGGATESCAPLVRLAEPIPPRDTYLQPVDVVDGMPIYLHVTESEMPWRIAVARPPQAPRYGSTSDARNGRARVRPRARARTLPPLRLRDELREPRADDHGSRRPHLPPAGRDPERRPRRRQTGALTRFPRRSSAPRKSGRRGVPDGALVDELGRRIPVAIDGTEDEGLEDDPSASTARKRCSPIPRSARRRKASSSSRCSRASPTMKPISGPHTAAPRPCPRD